MKKIVLLAVILSCTGASAQKVLVDSKTDLNKTFGHYRGSGKAVVSVDKSTTHKGQPSIKLHFVKQQYSKKHKKYYMNSSLVLGGKNNAYNSSNALEARENTVYKCSFYLKGDVKGLCGRIRGWKVGDHSPKGRTGIPATVYNSAGKVVKKIDATGEWSRYEIVSKPVKGCDRLVFALGIFKAGKEEDKDLANKAIYVAKIVITEGEK